MKDQFLFPELSFLYRFCQGGSLKLDAFRKEDLSQAFDCFTDPVLIVDRETKIHYANLAAARRFNLAVDRLIGRTLLELFPFKEVNARWQTVLQAVHRYSCFSFIDHHKGHYALIHVVLIHHPTSTEHHYLIYALEGLQSVPNALFQAPKAETQVAFEQIHESSRGFFTDPTFDRFLRISLALAHAATGASAAEDLKTALDLLCAQACQALQVPVAVIRLYNPYRNQLELAGSFGLSQEHIAKHHAVPYAPLAYLASEVAPRVFVAALDQSPSTPADNLPYRAELRASVVGNIVRQDRFLGVLVVLLPRSRLSLSKEDLLFVQALAEQASISIERFRLMEVQKRRTRELESLVRIAVSLRETWNKKEAMVALVNALAGEPLIKSAAVYLLEGERYELLSSNGQNWPIPLWLEVCEHPLWQSGSSIFFRQLSNSCHLLHEGVYTPYPLEEVEGVAIPMRAAAAIAGVLLIAFSTPVFLSEEDRHHLHLLQEISDAALRRAEALERLEHLVLERTRELTILYEITTLLNAPADLRESVDQVLDRILSIVPAEFVVVHLFDATQKRLRWFAGKSSSGEDGTLLEPSMKQPLWETVFAQNHALFVPASNEPAQSGLSLCEHYGYYGLPIRSRGDVLGVLSLFCSKEKVVSLNDQALLTAIADQLGLTIERARLIERGEEIAKLEERQRLARDLHDALTQSLYSMTLLTSGYKRSLHHATLEEIHQWMDELNQVAQNALAELRLLLYELRPAALEQDGLHGALKRRLEAVEKRAGIRTELEIQGSFRLSPEDEEHFYRIAQEALNNALQHAHHRSVAVRIKSTPSRFEMSIEDDGKGFDLEQVMQQGQSSGLTHMYARARQIQAQLFIDSRPGQGTRLLLVKDYGHG